MNLEGRLVGLFSFDIGQEIHLEAVRARIADAATTPLERRRAAPVHLAYAEPPLRVRLGERAVELLGRPATAVASAWVHDFGAVTVLLEVPLRCALADLPALTASLVGANTLENHARPLLQALAADIAPAIERPGGPGPMEDYYVVQVDRLEPPLAIPDLLAEHGGTIASALRCEPAPLSAAETVEALRNPLSYYPGDLLLTEWNVALIVDPDYHDAVAILEFLNVQLVELRFYDALLDRRIGALGTLERRHARRLPLLYRAHHRAIDELATIRVDMATIFERIHNALKLGGDVYLAKIYTMTAQRLGLEAWEGSVARKLEVLQKLYELLVQRAATARAEALELAIVLLIVVEILLSLVR
ncbi:MAG TPA: hypothetical protein VFD92_19760 [Candidatus Binatia bacterium]|nr:hypothetical protein [Candidatus Binatia bacterium]